MRILLVEDEVRLARSYTRNLEDDGHTVTTVHDGDVAYETVSAAPDAYDALIVDVLLPGRNGIALCRDLRRAGVRTPILLLTALDATQDKVAGLDAGADDYITKPFPFEELLARLRALARRPHGYNPAGGNPELVVDDLVIDLLRHEVYRGKELVTLTAREFALLELLARNANRVLSREVLMTRIWPDGTEAGSNVLDTYIHYLRDKIDRSASHKLIHTVRGVGYSLRSPRERR
ncbi:MAG TPA: response regulator transcription factor [Ktedonobacterales bacterium]|nr:response regulator transcription factor [Ktedonobacterales bacterium]